LSQKHRSSSFRNALIMGGGTFFITLVLGYFSQFFLTRLASRGLSLGLLLIIILIGITFDIVGIASAAAEEAPLNAKAAKKIKGAREALDLVRNAEVVTTFAIDLVGDVTSLLSGALAAMIVLPGLESSSSPKALLYSTLLMATTSAIIVGGKAWARRFALQECNDIILVVGRLLYELENSIGWRPFRKPRKGRRT